MSARGRMAAIGIGALLGCAAWGQVTFRYFYDANGQLFRVLDSSGNLVEYDYDASGNPTEVRRSSVAAGSLAILNLVPQRGQAGATVTIYGQNFSSLASGDTVMFNGVAATVISASSTQLVVQAPTGVTTGPVSVTVNGVTVTSGTLSFTVPGVPVITSISPATGATGETLTIDVQGSGLTNASYQFEGAGGIGITQVKTVSDTSASFAATIGAVGGVYVLVASGDNGPGSSVATAGNTFRVFGPPGSNYAVVTLAVFNTYIPPGTEPGIPAGSNFAEEHLAVLNTYIPPGTQPGVPPGSNFAQENLAVLNTYIAPGTQPGVPAGSNYAFELFATSNTNANGPMAPPTISIAPLLRSSDAGSSSAGAAGNLSAMTVGETAEIDIGSAAGFLPGLQFLVNGATLASSANGSLKTYFTAPYGAKTLTLQAAGQATYGEAVSSLPAEISVTPDLGRTVAGRAMDADGRPLPGAALTWQASGLTAEYYQFNRSLSEVPDLTGLQPVRTAYVSALNYPNPQQVFGPDPLGAGLGQNYAVRFTGKLSIAAAGEYRFQLNAQSGARLAIDGVTITSGPEAGATLAAGEHDLEVIYYESGAAAAVQLLWTPPGGVPGIVPPSVLTTTARALAAGADGHFQFIVPAALSGVQVSVANGQGSVALGQ